MLSYVRSYQDKVFQSEGMTIKTFSGMWFLQMHLGLSCRRSVRTGGLVAILVNLVVLLNFFVSYLHTTRTHRVYVLGTRKLPEAEANFTLPDPSAVSYYQQWIRRDLQPWRVEGISTVSCICYVGNH